MSDRIESPRLQELDPDRTAEFWTEVTEQGTPVVEPASDGDVWLTFLYRAREPVSDVSVFGGPAGWDPPVNVMQHLAGTDVWYLTFRVRSDLRCTYRLAVDEVLGNERRIWAYTPRGYVPDAEPLPFLVLFDGDTVLGPMPMPTILDNLIEAGRIPPMIAVLVDSLTQEVRNRELPCGAPFLEYLTDELLPWVRERYRITGDPARTIVAGQSHGGQAAAFAALRRPDVFGNVISQSGSFWWRPDGEDEHEWLTRQYAAAERRPVRFWLEAGLQERGQTPGRGPSILVANRHLRTILRSKGYDVQYSEFNGGHDRACWRGSIADALIALT
ncbi:alpha/beta hydrolase [Kribbella sp.]|uniref:alpha/beta hydrolase n=1 Tax=Kribbella sp. TaxID=1871183 RepID=UPI002D72ABB4|nr:alpha/beta hydrolase-fold protein [Kribbella sp.]HZX04739.1 alpha/beta hydrolase-fold protein [Kribbella sp.]